MREIKKKVEVEKILYVSDDGKQTSENKDDICLYEEQLFAKDFPDEFFKTINNHAVFANGKELTKEDFTKNCNSPMKVLLFKPFTEQELESMQRYSETFVAPFCLRYFCACICESGVAKYPNNIYVFSFEENSYGYGWVCKDSLQRLKNRKQEIEQKIQNIEQVVTEKVKNS